MNTNKAPKMSQTERDIWIEAYDRLQAGTLEKAYCPVTRWVDGVKVTEMVDLDAFILPNSNGGVATKRTIRAKARRLGII